MPSKIVNPPKDGDRRRKVKFIITPKTLMIEPCEDIGVSECTFEKRWFSLSAIIQEYVHIPGVFAGWEDIMWESVGEQTYGGIGE